MKLVVELRTLETHRAEIEAIWTELEALCRPRYWLSWAWTSTWLDSLPRELRPQLVVVRRGGVVIAAFFLRVDATVRHRVLRSRVGHVNQTGSAVHDRLHIEYNSWLSRPGHDVDVSGILDRLPVAWDELVLSRLDERALPGNSFAGLAARYNAVRTSSETCPQVDLQEVRDAEGGYLSLLNQATRANIRRARRAYETHGELVLEHAKTVADARTYLGELAELSKQRFAMQKRGSSFDSSYFRDFHEQLITRRWERGEVQLLRLRAGKKPIGLLYNFVHAGIVSFYQSGMHYEVENKYKPGLLLHAEAIAWNAATGHQLYDFLGGDARYKQELATTAGEVCSIRVQKRLSKFLVENAAKELRDWLRRFSPPKA